MAFIKDNNYRLTLERNDTLIHLQGELNWGVSKEVSKILKYNLGIEGIILDSTGGRIYEGRELAKLISATEPTYQLKCSSLPFA